MSNTTTKATESKTLYVIRRSAGAYVVSYRVAGERLAVSLDTRGEAWSFIAARKASISVAA